jgi:hypothetical protein
MNRFAALLGIVLVIVVAVGYCRGWFHATAADSDGQHSVTVTVDKDKFDQDKATVKQDVQNIGHQP